MLREKDVSSEEAEKLRDILAMREEGMTYQQIADKYGYKDRSTITKIIKRG